MITAFTNSGKNVGGEPYYTARMIKKKNKQQGHTKSKHHDGHRQQRH
jgi:hypothetical protein